MNKENLNYIIRLLENRQSEIKDEIKSSKRMLEIDNYTLRKHATRRIAKLEAEQIICISSWRQTKKLMNEGVYDE